MNINASIIDQQVRALAERKKTLFFDFFPQTKGAESILRSIAFILLTVRALLDLTEEEALDCITDGGNDFGVDAIQIGDIQDREFSVTLFQAKYSADFEKDAKFPQVGIEKMLQAVNILFDPTKAVTLNPALNAQIEEIHSLIGEGNIPQVRIVFCSNGSSWTVDSQKIIDAQLSGFGNQVSIEFINHNSLVSLLQSKKPVDATLTLLGGGIVEDFNFRRVLIGKVALTQIKDLFDAHGDRLLERNIRRYLGTHKNWVNNAIATTLKTPSERSIFYFYNNGITIVCNDLRYNALQKENWRVQLTGLQIINGGQTCRTIQEVLSDPALSPENLETACVLIRVYELPETDVELVRTITYATNSQNPVDLRDLHSNDDVQQRLAASIDALGYMYHRQRSSDAVTPKDITSSVAAEAVFCVWRKRPHQAKFRSSELFGKYYDAIFTNQLNGAQVIAAVLLFRLAENRRKRPRESDLASVRYASCFYAMLMGVYLLRDLRISLEQLDHRNFSAALEFIENKGEAYLTRSMTEIESALANLYVDKETLSLQRLSATFRRGDLIEKLDLSDQLQIAKPN